MAYYIIVAIILILLGILAYYCDLKNEPKIRKNVEVLYVNGNFAIGIVSGGNYTNLSGGGTLLGCISYGFVVPISTKYPRGYGAGCLGYAQAKQISKRTFSVWERVWFAIFARWSACNMVANDIVIFFNYVIVKPNFHLI